MKTRHITYALLLSFIGLLSCSDDNEKEKIDEELQEAILLASNGNGIDFFKIPNSNDFASIPQDPNNELTPEKIELGKNLYHESVFGTEGEFPFTAGEYSCASCHHAAAGFQSGLAQGIGEGGEGFGLKGETRTRNLLCAADLCDVQPLRSPTILNSAFQPLMLWNGQFGATNLNQGTEAQWTTDTPKEVNHLGFEGLETQAIAGLDVHRFGYTTETVGAHGYKEMFDQVFVNDNEEERYTSVNAGLAIAAYERTLLANEAPFQKYLSGNTSALSDYEKEGAILFFSKANCASCHTGPALNAMEFHALGMNEFDASEVTHYKEDDPAQFGRFQFTQVENDKYKFKTPQLYNLKDVDFFGHGASFHTVKEVIEYKNLGQIENPNVPVSQLAEEFKPLSLTNDEIEKITAFILNGLYDPNLDRYVPTSLPSGKCFPNADEVSLVDLGCN